MSSQTVQNKTNPEQTVARKAASHLQVDSKENDEILLFKLHMVSETEVRRYTEFC